MKNTMAAIGKIMASMCFCALVIWSGVQGWNYIIDSRIKILVPQMLLAKEASSTNMGFYMILDNENEPVSFQDQNIESWMWANRAEAESAMEYAISLGRTNNRIVKVSVPINWMENPPLPKK